MGLFSNIVNSVKDIVSSIADTTVNFIGNVTDSFRPEKSYGTDVTPSHRRQSDIVYQDDIEYDDLYDDYIDYIDSFWY